jgi:hypothetical protein
MLAVVELLLLPTLCFSDWGVGNALQAHKGHKKLQNLQRLRIAKERVVNPRTNIEKGINDEQQDVSDRSAPSNKSESMRGPLSNEPAAFSSHTCTGQVFMNEEWIGRSCYYRNLCFNTLSREFVYYRESDEPRGEIPHDQGPSYFKSPGSARSYMHANMDVSLIPWNGMEGLDMLRFVANPGGQGYKWAPKVVEGPIPESAVFDTSSSLFILYYAYIDHNVGHILMDDFLPWFRLMQMFNLLTHDMQPLSYFPSKKEVETAFEFRKKATGDGGNLIQTTFQCLGFERYNAEAESFISEECRNSYEEAMTAPAKDERERGIRGQVAAEGPACEHAKASEEHPANIYIDEEPLNTVGLWWYRKGMIRLCKKLTSKFLPAMSTKPIRQLDTFADYEAGAEEKLVCFPRLLAGSGALSEHCSDLTAHGHRDGQDGAHTPLNNDVLLCNAAAGSTYFEFRNWMVSNLQLQDLPRPCQAGQKLSVLMGLRSSKGRIEGAEDEKYSSEADAHWKEASLEINGMGLNSLPVVLSELSLEEQVTMYASSVVAIQQSGGASNTALFLPKGATLILLAPKFAKNDYMLWGRMAHITVEWIEMDDFNSLFDMDVLTKLVGHAVKRYHLFNDCYDAYSEKAPSHIDSWLKGLQTEPFKHS